MGLAHPLDPIVIIGEKGLTDNVINEVDGALAHHELIKVRLPAMDRIERAQLAERVADVSESSIVNSIGRIVIIYRKAKKPKIELPKT